MTREAVAAVDASGALKPKPTPALMARLHVPIDHTEGSTRYEARAVARLCALAAPTSVAVVGPRGAGKSSFALWVCDHLGERHLPLRLPVSVLKDPTDIMEVMRLTLSLGLDLTRLSKDEREELQAERADTEKVSRNAAGITGYRFGRRLPVQVDADTGSLRAEYQAGKLQGEYLGGLRRLQEILGSHGFALVMVFEDTEAITGTDDPTVVDAFFDGPIRLFVQELGIACLVAVQSDLAAASRSYQRLAESMEVVEIPRWGTHAPASLEEILKRRFEEAGIPFEPDQVFGSDALHGLVQFYDDTGGNVRKVLSAAHEAVASAVDGGVELVSAAHVRVGASGYR